MSYEPKGKMQYLLEAMKDSPDRIWSVDAVAQALGVSINSVRPYTEYAVKSGALYRSDRTKKRQVRYSLWPMDDGPKLESARADRLQPRAVPKWDPADDFRVPRVVPGWKPPVMVPVR